MRRRTVQCSSQGSHRLYTFLAVGPASTLPSRPPAIPWEQGEVHRSTPDESHGVVSSFSAPSSSTTSSPGPTIASPTAGRHPLREVLHRPPWRAVWRPYSFLSALPFSCRLPWYGSIRCQSSFSSSPSSSSSSSGGDDRERGGREFPPAGARRGAESYPRRPPASASRFTRGQGEGGGGPAYAMSGAGGGRFAGRNVPPPSGGAASSSSSASHPSHGPSFHARGPEKYGINPSGCSGAQFLSLLHRLRGEYKQYPSEAQRRDILHLLRHFSLKRISNLDGRVVFQLLELLARLHPPSAFLLYARSSGSGFGKTFFSPSSSLSAVPPSFASDSLLVQEAIAWLSLYGASPSTPPKLVTRCIRELLLLDCRELLIPIFVGCKEIVWMTTGTARKEGRSGGGGGGAEGAVRVGGSGDGAILWLTAMLHALTYHDRRSTSTPQQLWPMVEQLVQQVMLSGSVEHASSGDVRLLLEALGMAAMRAPEMLADIPFSFSASPGGVASTLPAHPLMKTNHEEDGNAATGSRRRSTLSLSPLWGAFVEHLFVVIGQERVGELVDSLSLEESLHLVRCGISLSSLLRRHSTHGKKKEAGQEVEVEEEEDGKEKEEEREKMVVEVAPDLTPDQSFFSLVTRRAMELLEEVEEAMPTEVETTAAPSTTTTTISSASVLLLQDMVLLLTPPPATGVRDGRHSSSFSSSSTASSSHAGMKPHSGEAEAIPSSSPSDAFAIALRALLDNATHHVERYFTRGEASPDVAVSVLRMYLDRYEQERWQTTISSSSSSSSSSPPHSPMPMPHAQQEAKDWIARSSPTHPLSLLLGGPSLSPPPTGCGPFYEDALSVSLSPSLSLSSSSSISMEELLRGVTEGWGVPACIVSIIEQHWAALFSSPLSEMFTERSKKVEHTLSATRKGGKMTKATTTILKKKNGSGGEEKEKEKVQLRKETGQEAVGDASHPSSYTSLVDLQSHPFPWSGESVKTLLRFWTLCHATAVSLAAASSSSSSSTTTAVASPSGSADSLSWEERVEHLRLYYFVVLLTIFHRTPTCITPGDFTPFFMRGVEQYVYFPLLTAMVTTCMANWSVHLVLRWLCGTAEEMPCTPAIRQLLRAAATSLTPFMRHASSEQLMALWFYFGRAGVRHEEFADAVAGRFGKWCEEELEALPAMGSSSAVGSVGTVGGEEEGEKKVYHAGGEAMRAAAVVQSAYGDHSSSTGGHTGVIPKGTHASTPSPSGDVSSSSSSLQWEGAAASAHLVGLSIVLSGFAGMEYRSRKPFLDAAPLLLRAMQQLSVALSSSSSYSSCGSRFPLAEAATVLLAAYAKMLVWHFRVVWSVAEFLFTLEETMTLRQLLVIQLALQRMNIQHTPLTTAFANRLYRLTKEEEEEEEEDDMAWSAGKERKAETPAARGFSGLSPTDLTALLSVWSRAVSSSSSSSHRPTSSRCGDGEKNTPQEEAMTEGAGTSTEGHDEARSSPSAGTRFSAMDSDDAEEAKERTRVIVHHFQRAIAARLTAFSAVEQAEILISLSRLNVVDEVSEAPQKNTTAEEVPYPLQGNTEEEGVVGAGTVMPTAGVDLSTTPEALDSLSASLSASSASGLVGSPVSAMEEGSSAEDRSSKEATGILTASTRPTTTTTISPPPTSLFDRITAEILYHLPTIPPVALAQVLHAYAMIGRQHDELFSLVAQRVTRSKTDIAAVTIASILASFAATGTADTAFFMEMIPRVRFVAQFGTPRDVTNVVFAYATVKVWHFKLFARLADRAIQLRMEFSPVHLVRLMQAYGMVEMRYDTLFTEMSPRIQAVADVLSPNELGIIVESYARVHMHCPPVFEICSTMAIQSASAFTLEEAERLLGALETVGHVHPKVWLALWTKFPDALRGKFLGVQQKMYVNPAANDTHASQSSSHATPSSSHRHPLPTEETPSDHASPHRLATADRLDRTLADTNLLEVEKNDTVIHTDATTPEFHALEMEYDESAPLSDERHAIEDILVTERNEKDK